MPTHSRRDFLERLGLVAASGLVTAGYSATARGFPANETISVGCIGTGGRAQMLMSVLGKLPGVQIAAVCDVWDKHLADAQKLAPGAAVAVKDYRQILERADIDAVLIGAPDHWHAPLTRAACEAGKDVYVEKPLTHDLSEGPAVVETVRRTQRVVQVGMQQRSMPQFLEAKEIVASGTLGTIHKAHLTWNRNRDQIRRNALGVDPLTVDWKLFLGSARAQPFDEYRFRNWRWFWDFGGGILTDLMVHHLDIVHWFLDLAPPARATTIGDWFQAADVWETPDTIQTLLQYPQAKLQVHFEGTFGNARNASMLELMGSEATLYLDRGRFELIPERGKKLEPREQILGRGARGSDFYLDPPGEKLHLANWLESIRSRNDPRAPVEAGVAAVWGAHLGNQALRSGQVANWAG